MIATRGASAQQNHLEALRAKHAALEEKIREEQKFPSTSPTILRELKLQKLRIKETISQAQTDDRH
jgi:hypothetical protein